MVLNCIVWPAWAKARQTDLNPDWLYFKQLRNKCTVMIRKAKAEYFLDKTKKISKC